MTLVHSKKVLVPLIGLLDKSNKVRNKRPTPHEESTRFPKIPWDLRTIIIIFPPDSPFKYLNLNVLLGLTGVPFDQIEKWAGAGPKDAFDLQFALEGRNRFAAYKKYHSIRKELTYKENAVYFKLGRRLFFQGMWPEYRIIYRQPEANLEISMELNSWPQIQWWAYFPGLYWHYTSFCDCHLEWKWHGDSGSMDVIALHDHGWGKTLLPIRTPLKVFRYEVLRLSDGAFGISLWTEGPFGIKLKTVGLLRWDHQPVIFMKRYDCRVLDWEIYENYAGQPCRVPRRWIGRQTGVCGEFQYEAERNSEPRAVLGEGFLYGVNFSGQLSGQGIRSGKTEGQGYVEQLGRFLP